MNIRKIINKMYIKYILKFEKKFNNGECELDYVFFGKKNSKKLLVIFSGFPPEKKPPGYNYLLKFRKIKCNKLFILDKYGNDNRGCYYLGKNNDFFVERAVTQLIENICEKNKISKEDIITAGTSKGGFSSLYFTIKNGYGAAVVGEPQVMLGNFLAIPVHEGVYNYIIEDNNEENIRYLNNLILSLIKEVESVPRLYLHCSSLGYHYPQHIIPLIDELSKYNIQYELDLGEYKDHNQVGKYFAKYAIKSIKKELEQE